MNQASSSSRSAPSAAMAALLARLADEDADLPDPTTLTPADGRTLAARSNRRWNQDLPHMARVEELELPPVQDDDWLPELDATASTTRSARLYIPTDASPGLIVFIHGGGFAFCDIDTHERFARLLSQKAQCALLSISYRLAPEHPFPAGLRDCIDAWRHVPTLQQRFPITRGPIAIAGDSAGANLALSTILHEQALSRPAPKFGLLFYGVYGADFDTPSYLEFENGPGLTRAKMMRYLDWYATVPQWKSPLLSPNLAPDDWLKRLPPLFLNAAEIDPLCSDTQVLAERLHALGRNDTLQIVPGVVHGFLQMTVCLQAARSATADAATAFRQWADASTDSDSGSGSGSGSGTPT